MEDPKGETSPQPGAPAPEPENQNTADSNHKPDVVSYEPVTDNPGYSTDYAYGPNQPGHTMPFGPPPQVAPAAPAVEITPAPPPAPLPAGSGGGNKQLPPPPSDEEDQEEEGMLRMSFLEHLEELRRRLFYVLGGFGAAFLISMTFCKELWRVISAPAVEALKALGVNPPNLSQLTPMESFNVVWIKTPVLTSIFLSSPWIIYQVWSFVSPGLYKRERKWAIPFVLCTAGLFIAGGLFAYYVAFRFGLTFLLGIGRDVNVTPLVSINEYFDLFVNVTLGIAVVFELPVLIFFLTLLRLVTPKFLIRNSRYAILIIVILAAVVTPTPDVFNLMLFATPMILLFYVGVFASWVLVLNREGKKFPWAKVLLVLGAILVVLAGAGYYYVLKTNMHFIPRWPFLSR